MGPLARLRVVELGGIGPGPFCGMLLADLGADVVRVDRPGDRSTVPGTQVLDRGKRSVAADLKSASGVDIVLGLTSKADFVIEGFRPGVAERLGVGPDVCLARNPALVYGRMTGWGQSGPLAQTAGHDINYLALAGALQPIGPAGAAPAVPLNMLGDFGGGGLLLALGLLAAHVEARGSGQGQVVDAAIVDGAGLFTAMLHGQRAVGRWDDERGSNLLDGGAPFYATYECMDGQYVAVGALEPQFFEALMAGLGEDADVLRVPDRFDRNAWPEMTQGLAAIFASRPRDHWAELFAGTDACVTPVLSPDEATRHPHAAARASFIQLAGLPLPSPAPRFSRSVPQLPSPPPAPGADTTEVARDWQAPRSASLRTSGP